MEHITSSELLYLRHELIAILAWKSEEEDEGKEDYQG